MKSKNLTEIFFCCIIMLFLAVLIVMSRGLPANSARLPLLVGWVTLAFTVIQLVINIRERVALEKNGKEILFAGKDGDYHVAKEDENGVFTLSEVQKLLASLGWNEYVAIGSIDDYRDAIVEMCAYDHVEYQEDNNLLEVKAIGGDTPLQMYIFQIDEACSRALNFKDGFNSLMLVRKF